MTKQSIKKCIWCSRSSNDTLFEKEAHTIPQSLGGKNICPNVCDDCNHYFGATKDGIPSIETIIKETFNITRARFLKTQNEIGKNKVMPKFSSVFFNVNFEKGKLDLKLAYRLKPGFQSRIGRQMKRGIFKMYLEEVERQFDKGLDKRFDFIREFARYDIGDYPVFYFNRKHPIIPMSDDWVKNPSLQLTDDMKFKYIINHPSFDEFEFLGHLIGIPISRTFEIMVDDYLTKTNKLKSKWFYHGTIVKNFNDIDLILNVINDKKQSS